jgi:hypothetical protein
VGLVACTRPTSIAANPSVLYETTGTLSHPEREAHAPRLSGHQSLVILPESTSPSTRSMNVDRGVGNEDIDRPGHVPSALDLAVSVDSR